MTSRFSGPPPCKKLHCEWLYNHAQQTESELGSSKQRNGELENRLAHAERASVDHRRKIQALEVQLQGLSEQASKTGTALAAVTHERNELRAALAQRQGQINDAVVQLRRRDAQIETLRRVESPRSMDRARLVEAAKLEAQEARRTLLLQKDATERARAALRRAAVCTGATLARVMAVTTLDDGANADTTLVFQRLQDLDRWVQQEVKQREKLESVRARVAWPAAMSRRWHSRVPHVHSGCRVALMLTPVLLQTLRRSRRA